eukprot:15368792-Alexandrium_andersonii.AAC.1
MLPGEVAPAQWSQLIGMRSVVASPPGSSLLSIPMTLQWRGTGGQLCQTEGATVRPFGSTRPTGRCGLGCWLAGVQEPPGSSRDGDAGGRAGIAGLGPRPAPKAVL